MFSRAVNTGNKGDGTSLLYLVIVTLLGVTLVSLNVRGAVSIERIIIGVSSIGRGSDVAITGVAAALPSPPSLVPAYGRLQMLLSDELGGSVFTGSNNSEPVSRMVVPHLTGPQQYSTSSRFSHNFQATYILPPSGRGTFVINAAAMGRRFPNSTAGRNDVWRVAVLESHVNSTVFAAPSVEIRRAPSGTGLVASFSLALPPALVAGPGALTTPAFANYTLRLWLHMAEYWAEGPGADSTNTASDLFDSASVRLEAVVLVPVARPHDPSLHHDASWPIANGYSPDMSARRKCSRDDFETAVGEGWYSLESPVGWPRAYRAWHSSTCEFPVPGLASTRRSLARKWIAFLGDSTTEELGLVMLLAANITLEQQWAQASCREHPWRVFDTGKLPALDGGRVSFLWASNPEPCDNWLGVRTFNDTRWLSKLSTHMTRDGVPDILVFNTGLHDINWVTSFVQFDRADFVRQLDGALRVLRHIVGNKCLIVWKTISVSSASVFPIISAMNAAALGVVRAHAEFGPFAVFDQVALLLVTRFFHDGSFRGNPNHCSDIYSTQDRALVADACVASVGALSVLLTDPDHERE